MTGEVKMQLLEVIRQLNDNILPTEQLNTDSALNILSDFRDDVREEALAGIEFPDRKGEYE